MSESLADLFASGTTTNASGREKKPVYPSMATEDSLQENMSLAYPAVESMSDVIPPDDGRPTESQTVPRH